MYDICGHRPDGDVLNCPSNTEAQPILDDTAFQKLSAVCPQLAAELGDGGHVCCSGAQLDQLQTQIQTATAFLVGCPACVHNFKHFFCVLTCSPDQSTFTNVTNVQLTADTNVTAVSEVDIYISSTFGTALYDSCKDVVFGATNQRAMMYVGGGAKDYQEWIDFLGLIKDKRFPPVGSPFQMNFPVEGDTPEEMVSLKAEIPSCGESGSPLKCSCGDCPTAPDCAPVCWTTHLY